MSSPLQPPDFFALEAGEALDGLELLLRSPRDPAPEELLRTVRLLRGAALIVGQQAIARAAAALETVARQYRDQPGSWTVEIAEGVQRATEEFRLLVRRVRGWNEADTARAVRLGQHLETLGSRGGDMPASNGNGPAEATVIQPGVRAFVAREGALIASALDRAARALRVAPNDREPLYTVIRRMQSLRGLAELGELGPLPDILDGIELAIGDLTRMYAPPAGVDEVMEAAALALTRVARDVAEIGRPDAEAAETRRFTELLVQRFAIENDVVPIESLYDDKGSTPLQPPIAAGGFRGPEALGPLELVSHGEHLGQTADRLARSRTAPERDLRLYQLLGTFRAIGTAGPDPVATALGVFTKAVREALAAGIADQVTPRLVECLRQAGELLRSVADNNDRAQISRRLLDVAHDLDQVRPAAPASEDDADVVPIERLLIAGATVPEPLPIVPIEQLLYRDTADEVPVVPIAALLYDDAPAVPDETPVVPIEALAPDDVPTGLEATFRTYHRLLRERKDELPSLATFLRAADTGPVPEAAVVPIAELCYRGAAALQRAAVVRTELTAALTDAAPLPAIRPLLDELLDLVPLALTEP